jgi:hypothetical protein
MKLKSLSYKNFEWQLANIEFEDACLVVGKNSTGKSRALDVIDSVAKIIGQTNNLQFLQEWKICFSDDDYDITYTLRRGSNGNSTDYQIDDIDLLYEKIEIGGETLLSRDSAEKVGIYNYINKQFEDIYPPANKLVIHTNRDLKKYPFLEKIALWAEQSYGFKFANISPDKPFNAQHYNLLNPVEEIPELYSQLSDQERDRIKNDLSEIGFDIEKVDLVDFVNEKVKFISIQEKNVVEPLYLHWLSQGLFRSISLLIFLEYLIAKKKPATVIIDDLCEGLDYERATKLGKLVFEKCLANNIQLIATSNDAFLMETVDLKYWNVLQRNGSVVTSLNAQNHPDLFKDFKFTGLSNFDFFASDYIAQKLEA